MRFIMFVHIMLLVTMAVGHSAEFQPLPTEEVATTGCLSEDGAWLILGHEKADVVTMWDVASKTMKAKIPCAAPTSIIARGKRVFVANARKGTISVLSSEGGTWKITDELLVGNSTPYHLSAARKTYFNDQILVSAGLGGNPQHIMVDVAKDTAKVIQEHADPIAEMSFDGREVLVQGHPTTSPACTMSILTMAEFLMGKRYGRGGEHENTPRLGQVAEGQFWVGNKFLYAGSPPVKMAVSGDAQVAFIDQNKPVYYELAPTSLKAVRLDTAMTPMGSVEVTYVHEPQQHNRLNSGDLRLFPNLAVTLGTNLHLFVQAPEKGTVSYCVLPAFADVATAGATGEAAKPVTPGPDTFPAKVAEGSKVEHPLLAPGTKAVCTVVNGPKMVVINGSGLLTWTPGKEDVGACAMKIRIDTGGQSSFMRINTEVISKELAQAAKGDMGRLELLGKHILFGVNYEVVYGAGMSSVLLLQGAKLRVLDRNGMTATESDLPNSYLRIAERSDYYVALAANSLDLLDKKTTKLIKSIPMKGAGLDLAISPQQKISYVAIASSDGQAAVSKQIVLVDETAGTVSKLDKVFGNRVVVDPTGKYLFTTLNEFRTNDVQIMSIYGDLATLSQQESIDIFMSYEVTGKNVKLKQVNARAGENGQALCMAPDGGAVSCPAGGGFRSGPDAFNGYSIPAFDLGNISAPRMVYHVGAYPRDVTFHPTLPLVAASNGEEVKLFDRKTGEQLAGKVDFDSPRFGRDNVGRILFTPGGQHLLVACRSRGSSWVLRSFPINLTEEERKSAGKALPVPVVSAKPGPAGPATPEKKDAIPFAKFDALGPALPENERSAKDIAKSYSGTVVLIETENGSGTGFVVGSSGLILTCHHVIGDAMTISYESIQGNNPVRLRSKEVTVVRSDPANDLALLQFKPLGPLKPVRIPMGKSKVVTGEKVYVIGNPGLGERVLDSTMTEGIVSNPARDIDGNIFIQTSAAVNPGSSGSPLFAANGQVIGIITLKASIDAAGFAVPHGRMGEFLRSCAGLSADTGK